MSLQFAKPASFGFIAVVTLFGVVFGMCVLQGMVRPTSIGLPVRLLPHSPPAAPGTYLEPVLIRLSPSSLSIGGRPVPRYRLATILREEIAHRPPN